MCSWSISYVQLPISSIIKNSDALETKKCIGKVNSFLEISLDMRLLDQGQTEEFRRITDDVMHQELNQSGSVYLSEEIRSPSLFKISPTVYFIHGSLSATITN